MPPSPAICSCPFCLHAFITLGRDRELRLIIDVQGKRILRDDSGLDEAPDARHGESDDTEPGEMLDARTVAMVSRRALATTRASDESSSSIACAPVSPETRERLRKNNEAGSGRLANPTLARRALFVDRSSFDQRSSGGGKGRAGSGSNGLRSNACCGSGSTLNASREPLREAAQAEVRGLPSDHRVVVRLPNVG